VLDHFHSQGRRRPALLADRTRRSYVNDVRAGYHGWVAERQTPEIVVRCGSLTTTALDRAVAKLVAAGADACYASSDDLALGLLDAAGRAGLRVPADLALAAAVDSRALTLTSPQISATDLFARRTGATAARLLIESIENGSVASATTERIPTRFVARASSAVDA
jgi:DNA-binding LacI/PurR family transcriptional regulator